MFWAYITNYEKLIGQMTFRLLYGVEVVTLMEYIMSSIRIPNFIGMEDCGALEEWFSQLMELEEDKFLVGFHQQVQKGREKSWNDRHIKLGTFKVNDFLLL